MPSLVSVGDIFVDHLADLTANEYAEIVEDPESSTNVFAPIENVVGGAGLQLATGARRAGFDRVVLVGKIGGVRGLGGRVEPDLEGRRVLDLLASEGVEPALSLDSKQQTGQILILYLPGDRRLMVSHPMANGTLSTDDLSQEMREAVRECDITHFSGYGLLQPERREAIIELMREAKCSRRTVALDLVPHDLYRHVDTTRLLRQLEGLVDLIFVELPAAHRIVYGTALTEEKSPRIEEILIRLRDTFPSVVVHIDPSRAAGLVGCRMMERSFEYSPGVGSRGQSAIVQSELLIDYAMGRLP